MVLLPGRSARPWWGGSERTGILRVLTRRTDSFYEAEILVRGTSERMGRAGFRVGTMEGLCNILAIGQEVRFVGGGNCQQ